MPDRVSLYELHGAMGAAASTKVLHGFASRGRRLALGHLLNLQENGLFHKYPSIVRPEPTQSLPRRLHTPHWHLVMRCLEGPSYRELLTLMFVTQISEQAAYSSESRRQLGEPVVTTVRFRCRFTSGNQPSGSDGLSTANVAPRV
jgi:hypothetical protein